jgi:mannose-6-phosphate isomerase
MKGIFHLEGTVKNYDWGGFSFLPSLLQLENKGKIPFAEYWIGTHPGGPSNFSNEMGESRSLEDLIGPFPFLLKILDVREMLSIQVHPGKAAAQEGFERENLAGIPLNDRRRNYRDPNEKPELMVALEPFWLLHGFKPAEELHDILISVTELSELLPLFHNKGYEPLYRTVMEMPQEEVNQLLYPLRERILGSIDGDEVSRDTEDYWAARAIQSFTKSNNIDRGVFSIYFFNLLRLEKGEGIFQAPGVPHAYLEGKNVEIMGNSDNVLRGGLTSKTISIPELMRNINFEPTYPKIILPQKQDLVWKYETPTDVFELSSLELKAGSSVKWTSSQEEILMIVKGSLEVSCGNSSLALKQGHPAMLISGGEEIRVDGKEDGWVFRARGLKV